MENEQEGQVIIEDDDGLNDLIDADFGPKDETPDEAESVEQPETSDDIEAPEETTKETPAETPEEKPEEPSEEITTEDADEDSEITFKYKDKTYKLSDLEKDEKLREKILTGANQQTHYQKLYDEQKAELAATAAAVEQLRQAEIQRQQATAQQQADASTPKISPEVLTSSMKPVVDDMVKSGWIEEDVAELYPNAVAGVMSMKDEFSVRIEQLERAMGMVVSDTTTRSQRETKQSVSGRFDSIFNELALEGGIFEDLGSQETRDEFLVKVSNELNPELDSLLKDPSVLRKLWIANNADRMAEAAKLDYEKKLAAIKAEQTKTATRFAAGEGGGSAGGAAPPADPTEAQQMAALTWGDL